MEKNNSNFVQVGETVKCGHCDPKFAIPDLNGYVCRCKCHDEKNKIREEFANQFRKGDGAWHPNFELITDWWIDKLHTQRREIEKAFGDCKECYGKGYATTKVQAGYRGKIWELDPIRPCSCDRGKQINKLLTSLKE